MRNPKVFLILLISFFVSSTSLGSLRRQASLKKHLIATVFAAALKTSHVMPPPGYLSPFLLVNPPTGTLESLESFGLKLGHPYPSGFFISLNTVTGYLSPFYHLPWGSTLPDEINPLWNLPPELVFIERTQWINGKEMKYFTLQHRKRP